MIVLGADTQLLISKLHLGKKVQAEMMSLGTSVIFQFFG